MDDTLGLIDAYLDGNIDDASMDRLDQMIASEDETAALFAQRSMMHRLMADHELVNRFRAMQALGGVDGGRSTVLHGRRWRQVAGGALAAGLLIAAALMLLSPPQKQPIQTAEQATSGQPIGLMVSSTEVRWVSDPVEPGQSLDNREHQIASGAIEFQSNNGATVTVLGPATFVMTDPMRMRLTRGRMHATVPRIARGFTVEVDGWSVVDLGTVFGVTSDDGDDANVYVYDGAVRVSSRSGNHYDMQAGQAMRLRGEIAEMVSVDDAAYGQLLSDVARVQRRPPTAYDALALWLSADHGVETDELQRVRFWRHNGDNNGPVAVQDNPTLRPVLRSAALNGRAAVTFSGQARMKLPSTIELGLFESDYEVFVVARTQSPAIQFLLGGDAGGIEHYELHLNGEAGVRFIPNGIRQPVGDPRLASFADMPKDRVAQGVSHIYTARVTDNVGYVGVDGAESAHHVQHESRSSFAGDLRMGMRSGETFGFIGDIAEVMIYRGRLTDGQRAAALAYLAQKYGLPLSVKPISTEKHIPPARTPGDTTPRS